MKNLFINSMSRNGSSLIYQLLFGHSQLTFYPGRITFICSEPQGFPFIQNEELFNSTDMLNLLSNKHALHEGDKWHQQVLRTLKDAHSFDYAAFSSKFPGVFNKEYALSEVFREFRKLFIEERKVGNYKFNNDAEYCIYQEDYLFLIPLNKIAAMVENAYSIQTIRNPFDLIASRKNMLLHHANYVGDPKKKKLRKKVIYSEMTRWLWSVLCGFFNRTSHESSYFVLSFESLHNNREKTLKILAKELNIPFESILLDESNFDPNNLLGDSALLKVLPSIEKVTGGKIKKTINSFEHTLSHDEQSDVNAFLNNIRYDNKTPEVDFFTFVKKYCEENMTRLEKMEHIGDYLRWREKGEFGKIIKSFSSLNFGRKELDHAFSE